LSKLRAEELVRVSGLDWQIARLGTVFGTGDRANFSRLAQGLRTRRFVLPGDGVARKSVLPVAKAAELLGRMAVAEAPQRRILNVAAPVAPSLAEICRAFSTVCGFRYPRRIPLLAMKTMARIGDVAAGPIPGFPLTSSVLSKLTTSTVLDVSRMQESFPSVKWDSFEEGVRQAAEYYVSV
jgi:UDP-glucose 4-epimerase